MVGRYVYVSTNKIEGGQDVTRIHKIFIWGNYIRPFASAKIRGYINNQFLLNEDTYTLRIVTVSKKNGLITANVYILNYYLSITGNLNGLALSDNILSANFAGQRCYLVTKRSVPLYVISLSNSIPQALGYLNIQESIKYLIPYNQNTIVVIGTQALNGF